MRLLLAGGGTGGHLVPGMAVARAVLDGGGSALFVTAGRPVEARILGSFEARSLPLESGRGAPGPLAIAARLPQAVARARAILGEFAPEAVLGLGGLASFPAALAARSLGIPVALLEINAIPGRATKWLAPLACRVFVASQEAKERLGAKGLVTGTPLREGFRAAPSREEARRALGLEPGRPTLLVLGGSQGSAAVNRAAEACLEGLATREAQILWIAGPGKDEEARARCAAHARLRARVFDYVDDAAPLFAASDLALCRSGAATVAELAAAGLPAVAIPYPHHRDRQQYWNARLLGDGAVILEERNLSPGSARAALFSLLDDPAVRHDRALACRRAARPEAARAVLEGLEAIRASGRGGARLPAH